MQILAIFENVGTCTCICRSFLGENLLIAMLFRGNVYLFASLLGNENVIDIVLTALQKIVKITRGRLELLTSILLRPSLGTENLVET